jgi:RhtB (resistance to homoserine/threonine) family protein
MGIHDLWLFVVAGMLLIMTPGPDMALIIARSTQQGTRAGMVTALGVGGGLFVHIAAAAIGLSALVATSAMAFAALKWIGAIYLVYIGIQLLRTPTEPKSRADTLLALPTVPLRQLFIQGFLSNALNPKVAVFFLAFLPQFVDSDSPYKPAAFIILGLLFNVLGTMWNLGVAWCSGIVAASNAYGRLKVWLERTIGAVLVGVGIRLALAERP